MVSHETSGTVVPGVCAFDDPTLGLHNEARCVRNGPQGLLLGYEGAGGALTDDLDVHGEVGLDVFCAATRVGAVGEEGSDPRCLGAGLGDDLGGGVAVLDAGRGYGHGKQHAECIDDEVAFSSLDLLAGIEAGIPP